MIDGGHGFLMLENSEIIEVKQGPYCGEKDKVRFKKDNIVLNMSSFNKYSKYYDLLYEDKLWSWVWICLQSH